MKPKTALFLKKKQTKQKNLVAPVCSGGELNLLCWSISFLVDFVVIVESKATFMSLVGWLVG